MGPKNLLVASLLCATWSFASPPPRSSRQSYHQGDVKPWDDPNFNKPENAANREVVEYSGIFGQSRTVPPRSLRLLKERPNAYREAGRIPTLILLGDLLFHAPKLLGPRAAVYGATCAKCHPNGATTSDIFVDGESDLPGNVDLLSPYFSPMADDGIYAPRNVPSLRGIRYTAPYERDGSKASLTDVIIGVVGVEFSQPLRPDWLAAIASYVTQFDFLPNAQLDGFGRLTARASPAAREGEALFKAPRAQFDGMSCATCHVPETFFTDHRTHSLRHGIGKGTSRPEEAFDTPTLINAVESPPYFFDGSATTLKEAVSQMNDRHQLGLSKTEREQLTAYLEAVGAVDERGHVPGTREQLVETLRYAPLLLEGPTRDDRDVWTVGLDTLRHELRGTARTLSGESRRRLEPVVQEYEKWVAEEGTITPSAANRAKLTLFLDRLRKCAADEVASSAQGL